jgi:hypothetical protein
MTKLNVQAVARWADVAPGQGFQNAPLLLGISVTDQDGNRVELEQDHVRVGYQYQVDASEGSVASLASFHSNGPTNRPPRWSSCVVQPGGGDAWGADEMILLVTVRQPGAAGFDVGSVLVAARYASEEPSLAALKASVDAIGNAVASLRDAVASVGTQVQAVSQKGDAAIAATNNLFSFTARLPSGASAVNALGNILATVEDIKKEV